MHTPWWIILCNTVWYEISDTKINLNWHFIHEQNEATKIMLPVLSEDALGWDFFHVFISQTYHLEAKEGTYLYGYCIQEEQGINTWTKLSADCHWGPNTTLPALCHATALLLPSHTTSHYITHHIWESSENPTQSQPASFCNLHHTATTDIIILPLSEYHREES